VKAVAHIFYGFVEPKAGAWPEDLPDQPGITWGLWGMHGSDRRYIATSSRSAWSNGPITGRKISDAQLVIQPEQRAALISYMQQHHLEMPHEEPAWILGAEAY
jgi:hypothetical protein